MKTLALSLCLLLPSYALAEQPVSTIPPGDDVITTLTKGQPAPYDGQLFDVDTALRWVNWLQQYQYRLKLDTALEKEQCDLRLNYAKELQVIEKDRTDTIEEDLRERLQASEKRNIALSNEINNRSFFKSMEFGLLLGVLATGGTVLAVSLISN